MFETLEFLGGHSENAWMIVVNLTRFERQQSILDSWISTVETDHLLCV
jgi:hypothetical protein